MSTLKYFSCIVLLALTSRIYSQIPDTIWTKTFGGPLADVGISVKQTNDGGFIVAGTTSSFGAGGQDIWLIKTDENGNTLWTKTFGGTGNDRAANVVQTNDNGYAVFGTTNSFGNGGDDFLLWKADSLGNTEWFKTYGTSLNEVASEGQQTSDGGFVIVGDYYNQYYRTWAVKADSLGDEIWNKSLRWSSSNLFGSSVQQTDDNGFVICGTWSYWYSGSYRYNYTFTKLSENGDSLFLKYYERNGSERGRIIRKTLDGNFILGGITFSSGGSHTWLVKVSQSGGMVWQKVVIGSQNQINFQCVEPSMDGGYIIAVSSVGGSSSARDFQILKTDNLGTFLWEKMIGGNLFDDAYSVYPTNDKGYIVTGQTNSFGAGDFDVWLVKFKYPPPEITVVTPNGGEHWMMWDTVQVEWSATGIDSVKIELSLSEGIEWMTLAESVPNTGTFDWFVQAPFTSWYCLMKISDASDSTIFDISDTTFTIDMFPSVEDSSGLLPEEFALLQNYPNPFNPVTNIGFTISDFGFVSLKVYDILGNEIASLVNEEKQPGTYEVEFNIDSHSGLPSGEVRNLSSGIYFYQLKAGGPESSSGQGFIETKKMVLMK